MCKILVGNLKGGKHMQDIGVDGREVLQSVLRMGGMYYNGL